MPIYVIERDNATLAVVESTSEKGAIVAHSTSERITARLANKQDLYELVKNGGIAADNQAALPL